MGSKLYGTDNENSDTDIRGFTFMPKEFLLGIKRFEQHDPPVSKESDVVLWNVEKFTRCPPSSSEMNTSPPFSLDIHVTIYPIIQLLCTRVCVLNPEKYEE